ncbi:MAG: class I SAM-dependent methyltransferase [Gemmatimonadaceae bacterium]|nr:class I SAM-dependent methyltransferase [Gemmatimonadaceae bacterium]
MSLDQSRRTFEKWGSEDPLYAVLTCDSMRGNRWDVAEFFATGEREIAEVFDQLREFRIDVTPGNALDFGCGVGRLSQALAARFERVTGVDIAESMVAKARELNQHGDRVDYVTNTVDNLRLLGDRRFDFIYSSIALQHVPPPANLRYVEEFLRILRPGGVAVFQVPNGRVIGDGAVSQFLYRLRRQYLRRAWKLIRGKQPYEMHYIPRVVIEQTIAKGGATLVGATPFGNRKTGDNYRYFAVRATPR